MSTIISAINNLFRLGSYDEIGVPLLRVIHWPFFTIFAVELDPLTRKFLTLDLFLSL